MRSILPGASVVFALLLNSQAAQAADLLSEARKDVQLRAMLDEMERSKTLQLNNLDKPYFVEYDSGDTEQFSIVAELGGLLNSSHSRFRVPRVQVRVGDYKFDNTNSIYSGEPRIGTLPIDDDYTVMRGAFWLDTDAIYKAAADQISRKRNALREISDPDKTPDFSPATAIQVLEKPEHLQFDRKYWEETLRKASAGFTSHPEVTFSSVRMRAIGSTYRLVNTEGTIIRIPQNLNDMALRAEAQTADGSYVWDHKFFTPVETSGYPSPEELAKAVETVASETELLAKAPLAEDYSGPVLFEQEAAAEMVASVMADALRLHRKPLAPPGADTPQVLDSVWSGKFGAKVVPDWMSIYDDPAQSEFQGSPLAGAYRVDDEGVPAQRVLIADKGTLKALLTSREPVRDINISNGHGRLSGGFGSQVAVIGNLFVQADSATPEARMKARLIEKTKAAGMKYGILIRRLDFPFTARVEELQGLVRQLQKSGYARTLASPLLAYRVYLDGHEELVRGFRFKEFSAKDLRDVDVASDKPYVLNYVNNGSPFDFADITSEATTSSVICPSLLFDSIDLVKAEDEGGKLPIVPMPPLAARNVAAGN